MEHLIGQERHRYIEKYVPKLHLPHDQRIVEAIQVLHYAKNEYILSVGQDLESLQFLIQGRIKVFITLKNGKSILRSFYKDIQILGELEIFSDQRATCNVQAIQECYCLSLPSKILQQILLNDVDFLRYMLSELSKKMIRTSQNTTINLLYPVENRLASYIVATSSNVEPIKGNSLFFKANMTEVAELLGTSYRHLFRALNGLCQKDILRKDKHSYIIENWQALEEMAQELYRQ